MKVLKKVAALLLAVMVVVTLPEIMLSAEDMSAGTITESDNNVNIERSSEEKTDSNITNDEEVSTMGIIEKQTSSSEQENEETQIEYVYVEQAIIHVPDTVNIVVALSDTNKTIESAQLIYESTVTGDTYEMGGTTYADNAVLFSKEYSDVVIEDEYVLKGIIYKVTDNVEDQIASFLENNIETGYTVTMAADIYGSETISEVTVTTLDEDGNVVEGDGTVEEISDVVESVAEEANIESTINAIDADYGIAPLSDEYDISTMTVSDEPSARDKNLIIAINAGHDTNSGHNSGASGYGLYEDTLSWYVAQACINELRKYPGVTVLDIRPNLYGCPVGATNKTDCLYWRVDRAHEQGASVFVDLHFNAGGGTGSEVWCFSSNEQSHDIADSILTQLKALGLTNRGTKDNDSFVSCKRSQGYGMAGFIVEHAFVDNANDASKLQDQDFLSNLGIADATGIANYFGLSKGCWETVDGKTYYYNTNGQKVYGEQYIDGKYYHFDENTGAMSTGFKNLGYKIVYYASTGEMLYGEQYIDGKYYHFNQWTGEMTTGFCDLGKKIVYYASTGEMLYNEQYIKGKYYHFDKYSGAMSTGITDLGYKKVYYATSGEMLYGEQYIKGKYYHFKTGTGAMSTGITDLGYKKVYYATSGEMLYGEQYIDGKYYHFALGTGKMSTGFTDLGYKKVYYAPSGEMLYGEQLIDKKYYHFNKYTGAMTTGICELEQKTVLYALTGEMLYGEQYLDGKYYHFALGTGKMSTGFTDLGYKKVYYATSGAMVYGEQYIDGKYYHFNKWSGAMSTGLTDLGYKTVYYDPETGAMLYGKQKINGKNYYFDYGSGSIVINGYREGEFYGADGSREGLTDIISSPTVTEAQMIKLYQKTGYTYPSTELGVGGASSIITFAHLFYEEAITEGVDPAVAWSQTMLETGWLKFGGQVSIEQFNFAGLGATDDGASGKHFNEYGLDGCRMGIRAQIQHLKAYAVKGITKSDLKNACVDGRFDLVVKGAAPYVEWLGSQENPQHVGWATGAQYGYNIVALMKSMRAL